MCTSFPEFFYSYNEALDHKVKCAVLGIGVDLSSVLVSEECACAFLVSLTLQRLHLGLAVLWALFLLQALALVSPSFTKSFLFSGIDGGLFKLLIVKALPCSLLVRFIYLLSGSIAECWFCAFGSHLICSTGGNSTTQISVTDTSVFWSDTAWFEGVCDFPKPLGAIREWSKSNQQELQYQRCSILNFWIFIGPTRLSDIH